MQAISERPRYGSRSIPEIAIFIYHDYLRSSLDFLNYILSLTISPDAENGQVIDTLREWVDDLLQTRTTLGGGGSGQGPRGEGTLVDQIIGQLDDVQLRLSSLVRSSPSSGAELELLTWRISALRSEQNKMAGILGLLAEGGYLRKGFVVKVLKWLKKCERMDGLVLSVLA